MAVIQFKWPSGPRWTMDVQIDKRVFTLSANYIPRLAAWTIALDTGDGDRLVSGVRVTRGYPLLPGWRDERFPSGQILAVTTGRNADGDPGRYAFEGDDPDFRLVYVEPRS